MSITRSLRIYTSWVCTLSIVLAATIVLPAFAADDEPKAAAEADDKAPAAEKAPADKVPTEKAPAEEPAEPAPVIVAPVILERVTKEVDGVWRTIDPRSQTNETFSRHNMVDVLRFNKDFGVRAWANNIAKDVRFDHQIWALEFGFKPLRFIDIDIPTKSGAYQRKRVWYLHYRVKNMGETPVRFVPRFVLESHDVNRIYHDTLIPAAMRPIAVREKSDERKRVLLNTVDISSQDIPTSTPEIDRTVYGVVTWTNIDPRTDRLSIYVQGLTNAYRWDEAPVDQPEAKPTFYRKTLQLNFWRPGDGVQDDEAEFHYGIPLKYASAYEDFVFTLSSFKNSALSEKGRQQVKALLPLLKDAQNPVSKLPIIVRPSLPEIPEGLITSDLDPLDESHRQAIVRELTAAGIENADAQVVVVKAPSINDLYAFSTDDFHFGKTELYPDAQHKVAQLASRLRHLQDAYPFYPVLVHKSGHDLMTSAELAQSRQLDEQRRRQIIASLKALNVSKAEQWVLSAEQYYLATALAGQVANAPVKNVAAAPAEGEAPAAVVAAPAKAAAPPRVPAANGEPPEAAPAPATVQGVTVSSEETGPEAPRFLPGSSWVYLKGEFLLSPAPPAVVKPAAAPAEKPAAAPATAPTKAN